MLQNIWDTEKVFSPAIIRRGVLILGILLGALAALNILNALGLLFTGNFVPAVVQAITGTAIPLAVWLFVRLAADLVVVANQANERLAQMSGVLTAAQDEATNPNTSTSSSSEGAADEESEVPQSESWRTEPVDDEVGT